MQHDIVAVTSSIHTLIISCIFNIVFVIFKDPLNFVIIGFIQLFVFFETIAVRPNTETSPRGQHPTNAFLFSTRMILMQHPSTVHFSIFVSTRS